MANVLLRIYCLIRFGTVTSSIKSIDGGFASEIEYYNKYGEIIGYFAYGYFDPNLPFGERCANAIGL